MEREDEGREKRRGKVNKDTILLFIKNNIKKCNKKEEEDEKIEEIIEQ